MRISKDMEGVWLTLRIEDQMKNGMESETIIGI